MSFAKRLRTPGLVERLDKNTKSYNAWKNVKRT